MPGETEADQSRGNGRWGALADLPVGKGGWPETADSGRRSSKRMDDDKPAYYDISILKPSVWTQEVGVYFFLGGLSAYAFVLARLAERFGRGKFGDVTRLGTAVAAAAALPCAPLLIWDLGDRKRFHHMLRVWKPSSPMNLGSWVLTAYTAVGGLVALREVARFRRGDIEPKGAAKVADAAIGALGDGGGIPLAVALAGYTGVLLSTTATPVWAKNPWIGALFSASAVSAGAGAVRLALEVKDAVTCREDNTAAAEALAKVETAARVAETVTHAGFLSHAGELAAPLTTGRYRHQYWLGGVLAGIVLPEIISRLSLPKKAKPWAKIAAGVLGLAGGLALRLAFVAAGKPSAADPDAARRVSRPQDNQPWEMKMRQG